MNTELIINRVAQFVAVWQPGCEEMEREWENGERFTLYCLHFLLFSLFPPSLSISYNISCLILLQNVEYGTFVANVTKNLTYAQWENNFGSNSLRESSASCEGLITNISIRTCGGGHSLIEVSSSCTWQAHRSDVRVRIPVNLFGNLDYYRLHLFLIRMNYLLAQY